MLRLSRLKFRSCPPFYVFFALSIGIFLFSLLFAPTLCLAVHFASKIRRSNGPRVFVLLPRASHPQTLLVLFHWLPPPSLTPYPPPYTPLCHPDPFLCLTLGPPSSSHASRQGDAVSVRCSVLLAPSVGFVESQPAPVARSAGIRGIFEPVHDGRLRQGRTFLPDASKILWKIVGRKCFRFDWKLADWIGKVQGLFSDGGNQLREASAGVVRCCAVTLSCATNTTRYQSTLYQTRLDLSLRSFSVSTRETYRFAL